MRRTYRTFAPDYRATPAMVSLRAGGASSSLVSRVRRCFQAGYSASDYKGNWLRILNQKLRPVAEEMLHADLDTFSRLLENPWQSNLLFGFDGTYGASYEEYASSPGLMRASALAVADGLVRLAEAFGAIPLENPEARAKKYDNSKLGVDEVIDRIEAHLGIDLTTPEVFHRYIGLQTKRGVMSLRSLSGLYVAWRIGRLVAGNRDARVLEIGPGTGWSAYYAWKLGIRRYTLIDLPLANAVQGYFLGRALGESCVTLRDELGVRNRRPTIRILDTSWAGVERSYDLVVNVDSLTELGRETAIDYLRRSFALAPMLLSINHEHHFAHSLEALVASDAGLRGLGLVVHRHPFWLREGYVEEVLTRTSAPSLVDRIASRIQSERRRLADLTRARRGRAGATSSEPRRASRYGTAR